MVLGRGTHLRGDERVAVEAGDVAAFPAGTGVAFSLWDAPSLEYTSLVT